MNFKDKTVMIVDNGLFICLAQILSKSFGRVLYCSEKDEQDQTVADWTIAEGFDEFERVQDFWEAMPEVDLFVFPHIGHGGLQLHLQSIGKRVWGSRHGDDLEVLKERFRLLQPKLKLDTPEFEVVTGFTALREKLQTAKDKWVKVSRFRGDMETWHHQNYDLSRPELDRLESKFGEVKELVRFIIEQDIETPLETGGDHVCIDGKFGDLGVVGFERKNKAYLAALKPYASLPADIREINAALAPELKRAGYRNFFSTEILKTSTRRILLEPTCRAGFPSGTCQFRFYANLPEILWRGADGELIPIKRTYPYCVEAIITHDDNNSGWRNLEVPAAAQGAVNVIGAGKPAGPELFCIAPQADSSKVVGSVNGMGNTVLEAVNNCAKFARLLKGNPVHIHLDEIAGLVEEARLAEKRGILFSADPLPTAEQLKKAAGC